MRAIRRKYLKYKQLNKVPGKRPLLACAKKKQNKTKQSQKQNTFNEKYHRLREERISQ